MFTLVARDGAFLNLFDDGLDLLFDLDVTFSFLGKNELFLAHLRSGLDLFLLAAPLLLLFGLCFLLFLFLESRLLGCELLLSLVFRFFGILLAFEFRVQQSLLLLLFKADLLGDDSFLMNDPVVFDLVERLKFTFPVVVVEQAFQVAVVWILFESQIADIVEVLQEAWWQAAAELLGGDRLLHLSDFPELLAVQFAPWQLSFLSEVEDDIADALEIVATALLVAIGGLGAAEAQCADDIVLSLFADVVISLGTFETLGETKVNQIDCRAFLSKANAQVFGLQIPMDEVLFVHGLDATYQFAGDPQDGLDAELVFAEVEQLLDRWPE